MPAQRRNRFVDFVADEHFLGCVKWVCAAYPASESDVDLRRLQRNMIDPFKTVFDIFGNKLDYKKWLINERIRQEDKTINNRIGDFHQKLLGGVRGWKNLGTGDASKVDLKKLDDTIFIELKNKFNTMNASSTRQCRNNLESVIRRNPRAKGYWAYIISKDGSSGEGIWHYPRKRDDNKVRKIWSKKVYELVTGDPEALIKVWKALPEAIREATDSDTNFSEGDKEKLRLLFDTAFR